MIPRHSLSFGFGEIFSILTFSTPTLQLLDLEKAYAETLEVRAVVLLPSVRAGIHMAIQATSRPGMIVVGPVYTCETVHHALALSGAITRLVDLAPSAFLMAPESVFAASESGCAIVLSEVYGIPYDEEMLQNSCGKRPRVRIFDMAMSIPTRERMRQLKAEDVALFSFGWGKPMYAGWGGIACFQDLELADKVREVRNQWGTPESFGLRLRRSCSILLHVAMNQRRLYGLMHQQHLYRLYKTVSSFRHKPNRPFTTHANAIQVLPSQAAPLLPPEWIWPMTALNRRLALLNLRHSMHDADLRRCQAEIYFRCLVESGAVRGPSSNSPPQSHFPIRVLSAKRSTMCDYLRGRGIDTSILFSFSAQLARDCYPRAAEAADEVIALPLGPTIGLDEVQMVSRCVKDGLRTLGI